MLHRPPKTEMIIENENYKKIVDAIFELFSENLRKWLFSTIPKIKYPRSEGVVGRGCVIRDERGNIKEIKIGLCFDALYFAEMFLHELGHVFEDYEESRGQLEEVTLKLRELYKKKGVKGEDLRGVEHADTLSLYILYPKTLKKLASKYKEWKIAKELYKKIIGRINEEKRRMLIKLIVSIRRTELSRKVEGRYECEAKKQRENGCVRRKAYFREKDVRSVLEEELRKFN